MSIDVLQDKIRKSKNPSVLTIDAFPELTPQAYLENASDPLSGFAAYCTDILGGMSALMPAVRFGFGSFAVWGESGLRILRELMTCAKKNGYYVLMDLPELLSAMAAQQAAKNVEENQLFPYDGLLVSCYLGSDLLKPFLPLCKQGKTVFSVVRTANKTAPEMQDLLTGGRLVHVAAADVVNRSAEAFPGRCGYSQVGMLAAASAADSLRSLRSKYKYIFLLLDGYDYPNANAKNCSYAFDNLGHGAAACAGVSILGAWQDAPELEPVEAALQVAEKMKKNLTRYVSVL